MLLATWGTALNILVFAALVAAVIYLFVLIVRALKKYIGSKEMLEDALEAFDGTIIMVSHDRYLLNRIPNRIIEMTATGMRFTTADTTTMWSTRWSRSRSRSR